MASTALAIKQADNPVSETASEYVHLKAQHASAFHPCKAVANQPYDESLIWRQDQSHDRS